MNAAQKMTPDRIAAIRARCQRASDGPWVCRFDRAVGRNIVKSGGPVIRFIARPGYDDGIAFHDGEFIAHAREDVPDLLSALLECHEALAAARLEIARLQEAALPAMS